MHCTSVDIFSACLFNLVVTHCYHATVTLNVNFTTVLLLTMNVTNKVILGDLQIGRGL